MGMLREKMQDDLRLKGFCETTRRCYLGSAQRFAEHHRRRHRDVERAQPRAHGDAQPGIRRRVHRVLDARALAPQQKGVAGAEGEGGMGRLGARGQQHEPASRARARIRARREIRPPRAVPGQRRARRIVEPGAAQPPVVEREAAGLDHVDRDPEAGREPQDGPRVLGNVGLVKREPPGRRLSR